MPLNGPSILALQNAAELYRGNFPPRPAGYAGQWPTTVAEVRQGRTPWLWIDRFNPDFLGPNSYDVTLDHRLLVYRRVPKSGTTPIPGGPGVANPDEYFLPLDPTKENPTDELIIPAGGLTLRPGQLYLGSTNERIFTRDLIPDIDGRSSCGRISLSVHVTAGRGDLGFRGTFTLEMSVIHPVTVRPDMRLAQVYFEPPHVYPTVADTPVDYCGRYQEQDGTTPSRFHL